MNPYLTLQIAHSYLFAGKRKSFWNIFNDVVSYASSTNNYPEAIHPVTNGGSMGDGHHGWAAAEIVLAVHDAFIFEKNNSKQKELILLQGIPGEWFLNSSDFYIKNAPVSDGILDIMIRHEKESSILINIKLNGLLDTGRRWKISLPFESLEVKEGVKSITDIRVKDGNSIINLIPGSTQISFAVQSVENQFVN